MGVVSEIQVPLPSELTPCDCGVESQGQAYSLMMPSVVSDAMTVTSNGITLRMTPAEM
jgi:hypothetical protein